ncbi:N-acetylglucosamine-6-phosphate deacetylase [Vibrio alfacsensis]|uniref:N-acetylglucosamine-6-phosphate deacetylase n=1 Tax=Vibrio alfacsensis TaxID=1074311 RepID=A0ABN5PH27_9VIBR|nr:N-acetylglucosamine-6-phosphate deacetylase [Vibrio alfacsensis]AXY02494.1 N-acetylglucosamine-6-phosphate deacetylase [Vibrio alfacsensis]
MRFALLADKVFTPHGIKYDHAVIVEHDKIVDICNHVPDNCNTVYNLKDQSLVAGFVDIHIHGRAGSDVMDATHEALKTISYALPETGVIAWCGTTVTAPMDDILNALSCVKEFIRNPDAPKGAELVGSFLEGPYFTEKFRGSHPTSFLKAATVNELEVMDAAADGTLLRVALAPEYDGSLEIIDWLVENKIKVSVAHTSATFDQVTQAHKHGADCGVHLFNGMLGLHHREAGCTGAVLYHDMLAELIADCVHVHPVMMNLAYRMKGYQKIALITDCMRAGGMPDGDYVLGAQTIKVNAGKAMTDDGSLAGSTCSLDQAVRNMIREAGVPEWEAMQMASIVPATYLGIDDRLGSIEIGKEASFAILDKDFNVTMTMIKGSWAYDSKTIKEVS